MKLLLILSVIQCLINVTLCTIVKCQGRSQNTKCYITGLEINSKSPIVYEDKKTNRTSMHFILCNMTQIPSRFFFYYPKLTIVTVHQVDMTRILPIDMKNSWNLEIFTANYNKIPKLLNNTFKNSPKIVNLQFHANKINNVEVDAFMGLKKLQLLVLSFNLLTNLQDGVFDNLKSLFYVSVCNNKLTRISKDLFR